MIADLAVPAQDPERVRAAARRILAERQFRPPARTIYDRARDWVARELGRLLHNLTSGGAASAVGIAVLVVAAALVVLVVVRASRGMRADPAVRVDTEVTRLRPARDWLAEAAEHERSGAWRDALRCRYRALVAELAGRGVVDEVPGRTSGEYRVAVSGRAPAAAEPFAGASELFDRAWYGRHQGGSAEAERFRHLADEVLTRAGSE